MSERYFHGTLKRLMTGDLLLPPEKTGAFCCTTCDAVAYAVHRRDRVYVTTNYGEACTYAITKIQSGQLTARRYAGRGFVYEIAPIGPLEADPDYDPKWGAYFYQCGSARIIAEYRPSWDRVGFRCLRQMIEDQNGVSLYGDSWPHGLDEFKEAA